MLKSLLSSSYYGQQIRILGSNTGSATPIHSVTMGGTDEIWLYAYNSDAMVQYLTVCCGGTASYNCVSIPLYPHVRTMVLDGMVLANGLTISAYAPATTIMVDGFVNNL